MNQQETGFTLIELLVVILLVGILAAIAGPGWSGLMNKQKLGAGTEKVYLAIQDGMNKAQQEKRSYRVSFRNNTNGMPQFAVNPNQIGTPATNSNRWENLAEKTNELTLDLSKGTSVTINYDGTINENSDLNVGENINVRIPNQNTGSQQCVIIRTILGTLDKAKGNNCP
jgi:prepilin-type N-terminal cleavage/methylation domain-containing protein